MAAAGVLRPDEEKLFEGQPKGFPFEGFQLEDVMLPEDDVMGIPSDDDLEDEEEIESESGFGSVIGTAVVAAQPRRRDSAVAEAGWRPLAWWFGSMMLYSFWGAVV